MADLSTLRFGPRAKPLAELDDKELEDELRRRRSIRSAGRALPEQGRLTRLYASLELPFGAPKEAVDAAYQRLREKYAPDRFRADPDRHAAANELAESLKRAYEGILEALKS